MSIDRRLFLASGAAAAFALTGCRARSAVAEGSLQHIVDESAAPAVAGMVLTAEGLAFLGAAGRRRSNAPDAVTKDDLWHLGSNTKAMTAALYALLVEGGEAKWGATLAELFPDLKLDPAWERTTIEQVMGHTAGLSDQGLIGVGWLIAAQNDKRPLEVQRTELVGKALAAPPNGKPGAFEYGNLNYILAGAAIERITGEPWETAITERLFKPLGMTSAGFGAPKGAQPWGHKLLPFGIGGPIPVDPSGTSDNPAALGPAGTVHASLTDYAKFLRLFLTDGGAHLTPESIARLTTPIDEGYALGWGVSNDPKWGGRRLAHEGSNTMWHAVTVVVPERKLAVVTVSNAYPPKRQATYALLKQLQERFAQV